MDAVVKVYRNAADITIRNNVIVNRSGAGYDHVNADGVTVVSYQDNTIVGRQP